MKHMVSMGLLWTIFCSVFSYTPTYSQCTLVCNDMVQVSIPSEGFAVVEPDMVLEGDSTNCPGPKSVVIKLPNGESIGDTVSCEYVGQVLTVKVIDNGSGGYCWGSILVEDKLKPIIECQDTTVNCTADLHPDSIGLVTVFDNCDGSPTVNVVENFSPQACSTSLTQIVTRTWYASDESGNIAFPCVQEISVVRPSLSDIEFPPNFDNTDTLALLCENPDTSVANTGYPMVDSIPIGLLCKISTTYEDIVVQGCENEYSVFREWTILDCCSGEILVHSQHLKIMDATGPVLSCPDSISVSANGPDCDGYFLLPPVDAEDNCSVSIEYRSVVPGHFDQFTNGGLVNALPLGTYLLTYEATDGCQNQSTCEVVLTVIDDVAPAAICDEITSVSLNSQGIALVGADVFDDGSHDACCGVELSARRMDDPNAPFEPDVLFDCEDIGDSVMVVVQVEDCKGNTNTCMVEVIVDDKTPPNITCPPDITINCFDWIGDSSLVLLGEPFVQENCQVDTLYFEDIENMDLCHLGTITRTYTVVDGQGYTDQCSHTITTIDTTAVQYFFPADTVVDCSQPLDSISAGEVYALSDCELIGLNVDDEIFPVDCGLKIYRTYTFLDWCSGFDTSYTQFITVIDTNPPMWDIPFGSLDTAYTCPGDLVKPPPPTATDFCSPVTVTIDFDTTVFMGCPNKFTRTLIYGAVDTCGNVADPFIITLIVNDTLGPNPFIPDEEPVQCFEDIPPFDPATIPAEDNCFGDVTIELVGTAYDTTSCSGNVIRTYLLTDVCGLDTLATHTFPFNDTIPPEPVQTDFDTVACFSDIPDPLMATFAGNDNCGGPVTSDFISDVVVDSTTCGGQVNRRWQLIDECGNFSVATQTFIVSDTVAPTISCPPDIFLTIGEDSVCSMDLQIIVGAVDNCGGPVLLSNNITGVSDTLNATFNIGTTEVVFYAEDRCGNIDSCSMSVNINENRPPTSFCDDFDVILAPGGTTTINVDSLLMAGTFGGEDFCTEVTFDFSPAVVDCDDFVAEPTPIQYVLVVSDAFGNTSECDNTMFLNDPNNACGNPLTLPMVAGRVETHGGDAMEGIEVQLIDVAATSVTQTETYGLFQFNNVPSGASCTLQPYKNDYLLNGVTTFDLLLITKHILGQQLLESPYALIAADVNASGAISTFDVLALRKVVLQIEDEFPGNTSWRFISADYEFPNPANPFMEEFPESIWLPNVTGDMLAKNFVGVKVGDVNGSAAPNFHGSDLIERNGGDYGLSANDIVLQKGQRVEVPILSNEETTLSAMQATLEYDARAMRFMGLSGESLSLEENDYAEVAPGFVTLSWFELNSRYLSSGEKLFKAHFEILENTSLSQAFFINSMETPAIAYETDGNPLNISWHIHDALQVHVDAVNDFELAQNRPNPFSQHTNIRFRLSEEMPVRLELHDLAGRSQMVLDEKRGKGWHEVELGSEFFGGNGLYICRLVTPYGAVQRKMVRSMQP